MTRCFAAVILGSFLGFNALAADSPAPPKTFDVAAIDVYLAEMVKAHEMTGLAVAIVKEGKIVLAKGYGKRSLEAGSPVEPETPFAAGSVTKQFACAAIMLLEEDGKLSTGDKVAKYFPSLTHADRITLDQLMSHTSGYPDYYPLDFVDRRLEKPIAVDALISEYAGGKLDFKPGSRWSYSNTGYTILGRVVEKVSGEPFGTFVRKRILEPAGMKDSVMDANPDDKVRAFGYLSFATGPPEPARPESSGWLYAAGGLWASAPDLARWDIALMNNRVLKPESFARMTSPMKLNDGHVTNYGLGLSIATRDGELILSHGGAVSGFRASNTLIPRTKSALVILNNEEQSPPELAQVLLNLILKDDQKPSVPTIEGASAEDAALDFFHQLQKGEVDRSRLGEEFSIYMTEERLKAAAPRLKALGEPSKVQVQGINERGGMAVASIRMTFPKVVLRGALYRTPDGKIQQLLFVKE